MQFLYFNTYLNKLKYFLTLFVLFASLTFSTFTLFNANASDTEPFVIEAELFLVSLNKDGKEVLEKGKDTAPGQIMEYRFNYKNVSDEDFDKPQFYSKVPNYTVYLEDSFYSNPEGDLSVKIKGSEKWHKTPVYIEKYVDEKLTKVLVPTSDYTDIQLNIPNSIKAGEKGQYIYRVRVK